MDNASPKVLLIAYDAACADCRPRRARRAQACHRTKHHRPRRFQNWASSFQRGDVCIDLAGHGLALIAGRKDDAQSMSNWSATAWFPGNLIQRRFAAVLLWESLQVVKRVIPRRPAAPGKCSATGSPPGPPPRSCSLSVRPGRSVGRGWSRRRRRCWGVDMLPCVWLKYGSRHNDWIPRRQDMPPRAMCSRMAVMADVWPGERDTVRGVARRRVRRHERRNNPS